MLHSQKIQLEMSEKRNKINAMATSEDFDGDELDALNKDYAKTEIRFRSAIISEESEKEETATEDMDSEGVEIRQLEGEINVSEYITSAMQGSPLSGEEAEYNAANNLYGAGVQLPWMALLSRKERGAMREEHRAATTAPSADVIVSSVLQRVFADSAADFLGVSFPSVPAGQAAYPVLTGGVVPVTGADAAAANQTAATITANDLSPKRASAEYLVALTDILKFRQMEESLRLDLVGAGKEALDKAVVSATGGSNDVTGFESELTFPTAPTSVSAFADYLSAVYGAVDGRYAQSPGDVRMLVGSSVYAHAASLFQTGSGNSAADRMNARVSPHVSDPTNANVQKAIISRSRGRAVAPIWPAMSIIRDEFSGASTGQVKMILNIIWNFKILDENGYVPLRFKTA